MAKVGWEVKVVYSVLIFAVCFLGSLIPFQLSRLFKKNRHVISYANCVGGGVLLGTSMIHLLSDSEESGTKVMNDDGSIWPHFIATVGFLLAFSLEKVLFSHSHDHNLEEVQMDGEIDLNGRSFELREIGEVEISNEEEDAASEELTEEVHLHVEHDSEEEDCEQHSAHKTHDHGLDGDRHVHGHNHGHGHGHGHGNGHGHGHEHESSNTLTSAYLLLSVCALESFISGLALGIGQKKLQVFILFLAIVTHIWAESFALSVTFLKAVQAAASSTLESDHKDLQQQQTQSKLLSSQATKFVIRLMAAFSCITPVGIFLGALLYSFLSHSELAALVENALVAFAAGIFLYVATFEILGEEFESDEKKKTKWILLMLGFTFMAAIAFVL